jgi:hypothetical protein
MKKHDESVIVLTVYFNVLRGDVFNVWRTFTLYCMPRTTVLLTLIILYDTHQNLSQSSILA